MQPMQFTPPNQQVLENWYHRLKIFFLSFITITLIVKSQDLYQWYPAKRALPPCLCMADRALLAGYPRYMIVLDDCQRLVTSHNSRETDPEADRVHSTSQHRSHECLCMSTCFPTLIVQAILLSLSITIRWEQMLLFNTCRFVLICAKTSTTMKTNSS